jgi:benzoyl-CoA reductase/2-hydroxyglutaryl-CoA dehydratase subunit BcrC/BadD/HgdB
MTREPYIQRQRAEHGRKAVAVLPIHYPKELLTALDLLAVEVWGPPGPPRGDAAGRIQPYVCAVVRNALAFLASGGADVADAALFPHTCDSIQQLATLAPDLGGWSKPALTFLHPRGDPTRPSARRFLGAELRALASRLEAIAGRRLEPDRLAAAIRLHREIDAQRAALLDGRARLPLDDRALYALLRRGEWLWPEDHLAALRAARAQLGTAPRAALPVLVTGYFPEPAAFLDVLNGAGAFVAADDYACVGRRVIRETGAPDAPVGDPWEALLDRHAAAPPCPTRTADPAARARHLEALLDRSGARGVIVHVVRSCEPELFDVPVIRRLCAGRGVPLLYLEGELEAQLSGQAVTRVEAFAELLRAAGRAA